MLGNFFNKAKSVAFKVLGQTGSVLKRVGSFAVQHHQPIAMLGSGLAAQSSDPTIQKLGAGLALGSAFLTQKGIGKNYLQPPSA